MPDLPTYVIIEIENRCSDEALQLIVDELRRPWEEGGSGLVLAIQKPRQQFPDTVLHVSASNQHIIRIAEHIEVKKVDNDGYVRPVTEEDFAEFPENGRVGPLALSDVQRCILHAIHRVHFGKDVTVLPGTKKTILKGAPVVSSYEEHRYLNVICTHDEEDLESLYASWKRNYFHAPVEQIRDYFGEGVALFFSFAETYAKFLILISLVGLSQYLLENHLGVDHVYSNVLFVLFNILGIAFYLEVWKRKNNEHSYFWGTSGKLRLKPARPEYRGVLRVSPVSGKEELYYPPRKTLKKILFVSLPITVLCLILAFLMMLGSFAAEAWMMSALVDPESETGEIYTDIVSTVLSNVPSVLYSLSIIIFNSIYLKIARRLTIWENHRTQEQHDTHVTAKLVLFEFVNTFLALFYTGFYLQDIKSLRSQLFTTLMVQQAVNQIQEVVVPFFLQQPTSVRFVNKMSSKLGIGSKVIDRDVSGAEVLDDDDPRVEPVLKDISGNHLDSLHDDFMELWLQFGHVFMFSAVYPLAGAIALVNNLTELWADRYKLCRLSRKPRPLSIRDIGSWFNAFQMLGVLSIITNCWLLSIDLKTVESAYSWASSDLGWFMMWVTIEHALLAVFLGMDRLVSNVPNHVKLAMDRQDLHFKNKIIKEKKD